MSNLLANFTSQDLQRLQDVVVEKMRKELKKPDCDFQQVENLARLTKDIDSQRRHQWHEEKFGVYEKMADQILALKREEPTFDPDDIPF